MKTFNFLNMVKNYLLRRKIKKIYADNPISLTRPLRIGHLLELNKVIPLSTFNAYRAKDGIKVYMDTSCESAGSLIEILEAVESSMKHQEYLTDLIDVSKKDLVSKTLDSFLVTTDGFTMPITDCYRRLVQVLEQMNGHLQNNVESQIKVDYYQRKLTYILRDVYALTEALLEVADLAHEQKFKQGTLIPRQRS